MYCEKTGAVVYLVQRGAYARCDAYYVSHGIRAFNITSASYTPKSHKEPFEPVNYIVEDIGLTLNPAQVYSVVLSDSYTYLGYEARVPTLEEQGGI